MLKNKKNRYLEWRKLDNSAKIFPISGGKKYSTVFRLSAVLNEKINPKILEDAVKISLEKYKIFKVSLKNGFFWNYLEYNAKDPIIEEEKEYPCKYIRPETNNNYLFKVTYFDQKINIDIFHSLTDGNSGLTFFREIIYNYIEQAHKEEFKEEIRLQRKVEFSAEDSYIKNYDKKAKNNNSTKKAYKLKGPKIKLGAISAIHEYINLEELKAIAKKNEATVTQYLTAVLIYSIYQENYKKSNKKNRKRPIKVCIPVNLKKYFPSNTMSNFFSYLTVEVNMEKIIADTSTEKSSNNAETQIKNTNIENNNTETQSKSANIENNNIFEKILDLVKKEFQKKLTEEEIQKTMSANVKLGINPFIKLIPLVLKKPIVRLSYIEIRKYTTTTFSNIGRIGIIGKYKKYIDSFLMLIAPEPVEKIKCSACSFENKIVFTFTSILDDANIEKRFCSTLQNQGIKVNIESNGVLDVISTKTKQ